MRAQGVAPCAAVRIPVLDEVRLAAAWQHAHPEAWQETIPGKRFAPGAWLELVNHTFGQAWHVRS